MSEPNPTYEKIAGGRLVPCERRPDGWFLTEPIAKKYDGWRVLCVLVKVATEKEPENALAWICPKRGPEDMPGPSN